MMGLEEIKGRAQSLMAKIPVADTRTLQTDVEEAWQHKILSNLDDIFDLHAEDDDSLNACENFLEAFWQDIKGTAVSYTAQAESPVTHLLIDIASLVAEARNHAWREDTREELLPHEAGWLEAETRYLNTESTALDAIKALLEPLPVFNNLYARLKPGSSYSEAKNWVRQLLAKIDYLEFNADSTETTQALRALAEQITDAGNAYEDAVADSGKVMRSRWGFERDMPPCYEDKLNLSFTERLKIFKKHLDEEHNYNALSILMPGVYQGEASNLSSLDVLKTHILSSDSKHFYPILMVTEVELLDEKQALPYNPSYDDTRGIENEHISAEEWARLVTHSTLTEAVVNAKASYKTLISQNENLLGQLDILTKQLALNDAHGGRGKAESAGELAYPAIIQFREYYEGLSEEAKSKVPPKVEKAIFNLFDAAFNPNSEFRKDGNLGTCIGTRREQLQAAMQGYTTELTQISVDKTVQAKLIEAADKEFEDAVDALKAALQTGEYSGKDDLGISLALLNALGITELPLSTLQDVHFIVQSLFPQDLADFLSNNAIKKRFIAQIGTLESLVILATGTGNAKLFVMLHVLKKELALMLRSPEDFSVLLSALQSDKIEVVLKALEERLFAVIKTPPQFRMLLEYLSDDQRIAVYESMKEHLPGMIKTPSDFRELIENLSDKQRIAVYERMKEYIPGMIKDAHGFAKLLYGLGKNERKEIYERMKATIPELIQKLPPQKHVYEPMKKRVSGNFNAVLSVLEKEERDEVYESMKKDIRGMIQNGKDFSDIVKYLSGAQTLEVYEMMEKELPEMIRDAEDFAYVLYGLENEQRDKLYQMMEKRIPKVLRSGVDYNIVLRYFSEEQRTAIYRENKEAILKKAAKSLDFEQLLEVLPIALYSEFITELQDRGYLSLTFEYLWYLRMALSNDTFLALCYAMGDALPNSISLLGLDNLLSFLREEDAIKLYDAIKHKLPFGVRESYEIATASSEVFKTIKGKLSDFVSPKHTEASVTPASDINQGDVDWGFYLKAFTQVAAAGVGAVALCGLILQFSEAQDDDLLLGRNLVM